MNKEMVSYSFLGGTEMTGKVYFGFAVADSMFENVTFLERSQCTQETLPEVIEWVNHLDATGELIACLNPHHVATVDAMRKRFGIDVKIPEKAINVSLNPGDSLVVMSVRGLPRLADRREYTDEEIASAEFVFSVWHALDE